MEIAFYIFNLIGSAMLVTCLAFIVVDLLRRNKVTPSIIASRAIIALILIVLLIRT